MKAPNRIDVHQHVVPPFWAEELPAHGGDPSGWYSPDWTPQSAIGFMDSQQIDTALSSGHSTLSSLTAFAGVGQILHASDHPYAPAKVSSAFTSRLDSYSQMTDEDHDAINHGNAQKIFSRF